jgi:hypothetical protein
LTPQPLFFGHGAGRATRLPVITLLQHRYCPTTTSIQNIPKALLLPHYNITSKILQHHYNIGRSFRINYHFDNPAGATGLTDNSGVRIFVTQTLREHDIGSLQLGVKQNFRERIAENF